MDSLQNVGVLLDINITDTLQEKKKKKKKKELV